MPSVSRHPSGKPYFETRPDIHFSLSHTSSHVLCAVSEGPVGADIETIRPVRQGVAERVCAPGELKVFGFFELWVLKESFIKLTGNTNVVLKNIIFSRKDGRIVTPESGATALLFHDIPGCLAAVCSSGVRIPASAAFIDDLKF